MADAINERTPLLNDNSAYNRRHNTSTDSSVSNSANKRRNKPQNASRQYSTIDCAAHPEDCPLVTGIGLLALDGGWGWVVVLATMLCNFLQASMSRTFGVVYPTIQARFASTAAATTVIQSISSSLRLFGAPISSSLCDWVGARPLVIVGGFLQALGYGISAIAPNIYYLYFSLGVLTGIGGALTYTPTHILVNTYFNKKRGKALGMATSGIGIGTFLMAPLQTFLLIQYSYVGYCMMMGGILLNYIVGGALLRPIESNHASHKVAKAMIERRKSLARRRLHASTCSNPSVFYERSFVFSPTAGWETQITGVDDDLDLSDDGIYVPSLTASDTSKMAVSGDTSNMAARSDTSNMAATNDTSNIPTICVTCDMAADQEYSPDFEKSSFSNRTPVDNDSNMAAGNELDVSADMLARESVSTAVSGDTEPTVYKHKHTRSVTIHDAVTEISAPTQSTDSGNQEETFLGSISLSLRHHRDSMTSSLQEVSKQLTFFRKKFKLFSILAFVLYSGQNTVLQFCTAVPLTFLPQLGVENGYTETAASFLISVSGIFDIVGRYLFGFLFDVRAIVPRRRLLHGILGLLLGSATFILGLTTDYATMFAAAAFHGTVAGGYHAQKTSVVSEFVPITLMSDAVGFSFFFEGFGSLVAAPLFGMLVDQYSTYRYGYFCCGIIFFFVTVLVLLEYCLSGIRKNR